MTQNSISSSVYELFFSRQKTYLSIKDIQDTELGFFDRPVTDRAQSFESSSLPQIIVANRSECELIDQTIRFLHYTGKTDKVPMTLPDIRVNFCDSIRSFHDEFRSLFAIMTRWQNDMDRYILVAPTFTLLNHMPCKRMLSHFQIQTGQVIRGLRDMLTEHGYEHVEMVEMSGECSIRGDVVDIFCSGDENPTRITFIDDEVESIRHFDISTQKSYKQELQYVDVMPALFRLSEEDRRVIEERIQSTQIDDLEHSIGSVGFWFLKDIGGINVFEQHFCVFTQGALKEYTNALSSINRDFVFTQLNLIAPPRRFEDFDLINRSYIRAFLDIHADKRIHIISPSTSMLDSYEIDFSEHDVIISPYFLNISSHNEVFMSLQRNTYRPRKRVKLNVDAFKPGELVVHNDYGVGIFEGITRVEILGGTKDFIGVRYESDDKLLLPIESMDTISRYSSYDSVAKIDRLGKGGFAKARDRIKEKILGIADEIIRIQAQREMNAGIIIDLDTPQKLEKYASFEKLRGFELTDDQRDAIAQSIEDMRSGRVMDRLLSGDVGFGKTEVALSLSYITLLNGYNSVIIAPTNLISIQHYETFKERFRHIWPESKIFRMDRFTKSRDKEHLRDALGRGENVILVGTHSIFGIDMENVGLIVIDEEHKFGVKQKEILKHKALKTHVLSMSATPIPRTLNMAYSKLKSVSELKDAPSFKQDSKTFVKAKSDAVIREAILRELGRGGQVFYIFNNITRIEIMRQYLLSLLPNLRILVLHSQVHKDIIEQGMVDFLQEKYDVMLCTTIVESGLHFPNANTIIIENASNFGIAVLHQLRGRVGRGANMGFCYLIIDEDADITESAKKRLIALEKSSYIGSGANLAYNDLEIRGGGNLLGQAQSGHIKQVGFGMYVRMLEDTLLSLSKKQSKSSSVDIKLSVSAFLSDGLIQSHSLRLELYSRLSRCRSEVEVRDIEMEIQERFGKLDTYSMNFIELIIIKVLASAQNVSAISNFQDRITISYGEQKRHIKAESRDDDDILVAIKNYLRDNARSQNPEAAPAGIM